jgi:hypothetical protein
MIQRAPEEAEIKESQDRPEEMRRPDLTPGNSIRDQVKLAGIVNQVTKAKMSDSTRSRGS